MLEREVEQKLCEGVKKLGGISYKFTSPSTRGVPDRIVIWQGGQIDFVELKTLKGRLTPLQEKQQAKLMHQGCEVFTLKGAEGVQNYLLVRGSQYGV